MSENGNTFDPRCAACPMAKIGERSCTSPNGKGPEECPTVNERELARESFSVYESGKFAKMAREAALVERAGYEGDDYATLKAARPRIVELVDFARRMEYKKLGLLFCMGLRKEAAVANKIFETNGFVVVSAICKVGCLPKSGLGLTREEQLNPLGEESVCNPVMQAKIANKAGVDFNILLGLCVGHDSLVLAHLEAPASILAVKDRLLGHNPLAALQQYDVYYRYLKKPLFDK